MTSVNMFKLQSRKHRERALQEAWITSCIVNGVDTTCIIDTGCNKTAVPLAIVQQAKCKVKPSKLEIIVQLGDGSEINPVGVATLDIAVQGVTSRVSAVVMSGAFSVLLGLDWMTLSGCLLDVPHRQMVLRPPGGASPVLVQFSPDRTGPSSNRPCLARLETVPGAVSEAALSGPSISCIRSKAAHGSNLAASRYKASCSCSVVPHVAALRAGTATTPLRPAISSSSGLVTIAGRLLRLIRHV